MKHDLEHQLDLLLQQGDVYAISDVYDAVEVVSRVLWLSSGFIFAYQFVATEGSMRVQHPVIPQETSRVGNDCVVRVQERQIILEDMDLRELLLFFIREPALEPLPIIVLPFDLHQTLQLHSLRNLIEHLIIHKLFYLPQPFEHIHKWLNTTRSIHQNPEIQMTDKGFQHFIVHVQLFLSQRGLNREDNTPNLILLYPLVEAVNVDIPCFGDYYPGVREDLGNDCERSGRVQLDGYQMFGFQCENVLFWYGQHVQARGYAALLNLDDLDVDRAQKERRQRKFVVG